MTASSLALPRSRSIPRPAAPAVSLLHVSADARGRTRATTVGWRGSLNADPDGRASGLSAEEALLAAVAACFMRSLRWAADAGHVALERCDLDLAAARDDDPPSIRLIRLEVTLDTGAPEHRALTVVQRALRSGTVVRTVARAVELSVVLRLNGVLHPVELGNPRPR